MDVTTAAGLKAELISRLMHYYSTKTTTMTISDQVGSTEEAVSDENRDPNLQPPLTPTIKTSAQSSEWPRKLPKRTKPAAATLTTRLGQRQRQNDVASCDQPSTSTPTPSPPPLPSTSTTSSGLRDVASDRQDSRNDSTCAKQPTVDTVSGSQVADPATLQQLVVSNLSVRFAGICCSYRWSLLRVFFVDLGQETPGEIDQCGLPTGPSLVASGPFRHHSDRELYDLCLPTSAEQRQRDCRP